MKKIVTTGAKQSVIRDVPDVVNNDDQLLIKTKYVGVCMSEHYAWSTADGSESFGHEPLGVVAAVGKNVSGFQVGDRVSGQWGGSLPGSGGMTEYSIADPRVDVIVKLPDGVRDEDYVLEPIACIMSAVSKVKIPMPGTKVCVVGCGYMGCGAIGLLKLRGAWVTAVDIRPESLADAKKYGADEVFLAGEAADKFKDAFSVVMEWGETNESLDLAINLTQMCGSLYLGAYHTGGKRLVDVQQLNVKAIDCLSVHPREQELSCTGAHNAVKLLQSGRWNYTGVPTKIYPMSMFDRAQAELETKYGTYMKSLIDMTKLDGEPYIV